MSPAPRLIRWADTRPMPWKNGGGVTREVAAYPEGAGLDAFGWRISMASVMADGPFSRFEGVDRTLAVLEGAGLRLCEGDGREVLVSPETEPVRFRGGTEIAGGLVAGPILDLNVMTRRSGWSHAVRRIPVEGRAGLASAAPVVAVLCGEGGLSLPGLGLTLGPKDCVLLSDLSERLEVKGRGRAFVVEISARYG